MSVRQLNDFPLFYFRHVPSNDFYPYNQDREVDEHKHKPHPQDIEIAMHFMEPKYVPNKAKYA